MSNIGIKLADGKFYSIMDEEKASSKQLVLTTVKDNQPSVQIDVYRSVADAMSYVGSLIIDNIPPMPAQEPDIQLKIDLDSQGNLTATAFEKTTGEHQSLKVSLRSLDEEEKYEIPDFDFQADDLDIPDDALDIDIVPNSESTIKTDINFNKTSKYIDDESVSTAEIHVRKENKKRSPLLIALFAIIITAAILLAAWLIYKYVSGNKTEIPKATTSVTSTVSEPATTITPTPPTMQTAPSTPSQPAATQQAQPKPQASAPSTSASTSAKPTTQPAKKAGTWYKIKWGDTLWDLAFAYYRNPWLYKTIAKANKIKNPDLIISATWIYIPPR